MSREDRQRLEAVATSRKERLGSPKVEEGAKDLPLESLEGGGLLTLDFRLWPQGQKGNKDLLFLSHWRAAIPYGSTRKQDSLPSTGSLLVSEGPLA